MRALRGGNATAVIARLSPDHPGLVGLLPARGVQPGVRRRWTTTCGSSPTGGPGARHPNKPKRWIVARYFGAFNKSRHDRWVFGDRDSGAYLPKFAWTTSSGTSRCNGRASPDDPALARYWADRRRSGNPPQQTSTPAPVRDPARLLSRLRGTPPARRPRAAHPIGMGAMVQHSTADAAQAARHRAGRWSGPDDLAAPSRILPLAAHSGHGRLPAMKRMQARRPVRGLPEPWCPESGHRPVLRGRRRGNAPSLPDASMCAATLTASC